MFEEVEDGLNAEARDLLKTKGLERLYAPLERLGVRYIKDFEDILKHDILRSKLESDCKPLDFFRFIELPKTEDFIKTEKPDTRESESADLPTKKRYTDSIEEDDIQEQKHPCRISPLSMEAEQAEATSTMNDPVLFSHEDEYDFVFSHQPASSTSPYHISSSSSSSNYLLPQSRQVIPSEYKKVFENVTDTNPSTSIDQSSSCLAIPNNNLQPNVKRVLRGKKPTANTTNNSSNTVSPPSTQLPINKQTEKERFLQEFPVDRCTAIFSTRKEMEETLSNLSWKDIRTKYD